MLEGFKSRFRYVGAILCVLVFKAQGTLIQASANPWAEATNGVKSLYSSLAKLLQIVIGIGAIVVLAQIIIKLMAGDKESAHKLFWWLIGLAFGFVMLSVLSGFEKQILVH